MGCSTLATIKSKKIGNFQCIDEKTRVCLLKIRPNIKEFVSSHQAHVSY